MAVLVDTPARSLDDLWEETLQVLDNYTNARDQLSKQLSAGHISLARAKIDVGTGRSIGPDYYDDRMKARLRCKVTSSPSSSSKDGSPQDLPSITIATQDTYKDEDGKEETSIKDPINMFGVLVPPSLRETQARFTQPFVSNNSEASKSASCLVVELLELEQKLRELADQIEKARLAR